MEIALIGYGKMGKTIEAIALNRGHRIAVQLTSSSTDSDWEKAKAADVAIEFTRPDAAVGNISKCLNLPIPVVCGTTGWFDRLAEIKALCDQKRGSLFWASNFSIGVHLFWQVNRQLAKLMGNHSEYGVSIEEIHHLEKVDKPSGTAITTAEQIISHHGAYHQWCLMPDEAQKADIAITALRQHEVKGTHTVRYESDVDIIELRHEAKSRFGFAMGAVIAAEFILGKQGVFTMSDIIEATH